jgi:hypothetical protein
MREVGTRQPGRNAPHRLSAGPSNRAFRPAHQLVRRASHGGDAKVGAKVDAKADAAHGLMVRALAPRSDCLLGGLVTSLHSATSRSYRDR